MASPEIGTCITAGINGLKKNTATHIVTVLLVAIVGGVSFSILTGPLLIGYMRMIKVEDEGGTPEIADVFKGFDDFVPALLAVLVSSIIVSIGFLLCVIPGLLIMALAPTAAYLVAVGEKDGINAIKRAFGAIKANMLSSIVCTLVLGIVGGIGSIACGIGAVVTMPIAFIGMYHMAKQMTDGGTTPAA